MSGAGQAGNAASELSVLLPDKQGSIIKSALEPNNPGIDGWLDGVPVQLKEVQG